MILLSFTGTLRTIVVLVLLWMLLRWIMRRRASGLPKGTTRVPPDGRSPGDVRIEPTDGATHGPVQDADFEEIR